MRDCDMDFYFAWLVLPSIIFEELFEGCCYDFSNNLVFNLLFALLFWIVIAVILGSVLKRFGLIQR